jgi:hypothetical protein
MRKLNLDLMTIGLIAFGLSSLLLGLLMAFSPALFYELVGPYGTRNDHYIHDSGSFQIALAILLLVGVCRPEWRVPALVANAIQWGLHSISHLIDIGAANPPFLGYLDAMLLPAGTVVLIWLAAEALREERMMTA